jgi:hypothetical protein
MESVLRASAVLPRRRILSRVATKPFNTNYRIPIHNGFVVLNGDQIAKIEAIEQLNQFGLSSTPKQWIVTFHLSDSSKHAVGPSQWTRDFVKETLETGNE